MRKERSLGHVRNQMVGMTGIGLVTIYGGTTPPNRAFVRFAARGRATNARIKVDHRYT